MTPDFETRLRHIEKKIAELKTKDFLPAELIGLVAETCLRQARALPEVRLDLPAPGELTSMDQNFQGKPLLARELFPLDRELARRLFGEFLTLVAGAGGEAAAAGEVIGQELSAGALDLDRTFADFLARGEAALAPWTKRTPKAPRTMHYLVQAALGPSLETVGAALSRDLGTTPRGHGACPVCGSPPLMAEFADKEGPRHLTCSFCKARYRVRRLACVHCDTEVADHLSFLAAEEVPGYRADVCDACGRYVKTIDFRSMDRVAVPELDDLISLPLDILAQGRGYARPALSAWGF